MGHVKFYTNKIMKKKLLLTMKLTTFLIMIGTLQLSAKVHSQNAKINLNFKTGTLGDVIEAIENQSDFKVFYKTDQVNTKTRVALSDADTTITLALNDALKESDNSYKVLDKIIVLTSKQAQIDNKITGTITDANTGESLTGVNIVIEGTTTGVVSDINGKFSIEVNKPGATLIFSFLGYTSQKIVTGNQNNIDVKLSQDVKQLDEVVVVGYGSMERSNVSGSISSIKGEEVTKAPNVNALEALTGQIPGVRISRSSGAGI